MSAIANQWTGNGLPDGTTITAANVNESGNGSSVTFETANSGSMVTEGNGVRVSAETTNAVRRLDASVAGNAVRTQVRLRVDALPTGDNLTFVQLRTASAGSRAAVLGPDARIGIGGIASSPAYAPPIARGDRVLFDWVITQSSSPTATNGRVFFRVTNLTNPAWSDGGEFFYDSGYTLDAATVAYAQVRFGKFNSCVLPAPGILFEFVGWEAITVNPSHTSEAQAKSYFADRPVEVLAPTTGNASPLAGPGTGSNGWTVWGTSASEGEALADNNTATGVESPEITATATERIYPIRAMLPRTQLTVALSGVSLTAAGTVTCQVKVYSGSTVVATKNLQATTTPTAVTIQLTTGETSAITDWNNLRVGIRAVA